MSSSSTLAIFVSIYFIPLARVSARSFYALPFKLLFIPFFRPLYKDLSLITAF